MFRAGSNVLTRVAGLKAAGSNLAKHSYYTYSKEPSHPLDRQPTIVASVEEAVKCIKSSECGASMLIWKNQFLCAANKRQSNTEKPYRIIYNTQTHVGHVTVCSVIYRNVPGSWINKYSPKVLSYVM